MVQVSSYHFGPKKIAFIGTYVPRQCGIATFTNDLLTAIRMEDPQTECWAIALNDLEGGYPYPEEVHFEINQNVLAEYRLAADFLNVNRVELVLLQHEYGIFGGIDGSYILELLGQLRMPIVSTLHTVLMNPSPTQYFTLKRIAQLSDRVVVMSNIAEDILCNIYGVSREKIIVIPHGIPDVPFVDPNYYKDQFGVEGKKVILTFGLLSPGKGIEVMIEALPMIVKEHPDVVYIILGATHPHIKREFGESYRLSLQRRARELSVDNHVMFYNRYVTLTELCEFLGAADIYVSPYLNQEQVVSGTLSYALGTGKAVVSTPYWYAREVLQDGRGRLVPFKDPDALAREIVYLLSNEVERHSMRKKAYTFSREMVWKEVARKYLQLFAEVKAERESRPKTIFTAKMMREKPDEVPVPKLIHLMRLTDDVGVIQHAKYIVPDRFHGYCTDDNARALLAALLALDIEVNESKELLTNLACTYMSFLYYAFNKENGRFRNFMGYDRKWLEEIGSEDSHGRALWSLGEAIYLSKNFELREVIIELFRLAINPVSEFTSPRAWAYALAGIHYYLNVFEGDTEVKRIRDYLALKLFDLYEQNATPDWPWIEEVVTYANGRISQALIFSGYDMKRDDLLSAGIESLEWLISIQMEEKGHLVPIGSNGWYVKGKERARFDQQPLEAHELIEALKAAYMVTGHEKWLNHAERCLEWFLGRNDLNTPLYDYTSGGCFDGLQPTGVNKNQGAEATLSWLLSLFRIYELRKLQVSALPGAGKRVGSKEGEKYVS
ncbi:MAG: glycosyltransferase family 4 protein [Desulfobacterota bacterium]|nr:glycosyltransferase family 4 protein [Thermodesulfobacteriota bacterium]MDW8002351.1 glycosyltransferase family 4 protein [Deltaproteobacteria bacterium]